MYESFGQTPQKEKYAYSKNKVKGYVEPLLPQLKIETTESKLLNINYNQEKPTFQNKNVN